MTERMKFTFSNGTEAWNAMRAMDAIRVAAGYPSKCGGFVGETTLLVDVPVESKKDVVDVAFGCGAFGYATL